jgi:hypothetical protein
LILNGSAHDRRLPSDTNISRATSTLSAQSKRAQDQIQATALMKRRICR